MTLKILGCAKYVYSGYGGYSGLNGGLDTFFPKSLALDN